MPPPLADLPGHFLLVGKATTAVARHVVRNGTSDHAIPREQANLHRLAVVELPRRHIAQQPAPGISPRPDRSLPDQFHTRVEAPANDFNTMLGRFQIGRYLYERILAADEYVEIVLFVRRRVVVPLLLEKPLRTGDRLTRTNVDRRLRFVLGIGVGHQVSRRKLRHIERQPSAWRWRDSGSPSTARHPCAAS